MCTQAACPQFGRLPLRLQASRSSTKAAACRPPQAHEALAEAQEAAEGMRQQVRAGLVRAEAAELSAASLKKQLVEAQKEVEAGERRLQVRLVGLGLGCGLLLLLR